MKKVFLCFVLIAFSIFCQAQSLEIEKLRKQIQEYTKQDTVRVNLLNKICLSIPTVSEDEMEQYAVEALNLSRDLKYLSGQGYAHVILSRVNLLKGKNETALKSFQLADSLAKVTEDLSLQWNVYIKKGSNYEFSGDLREALSWGLKSEKLAEEINNKEYIFRSQNFLSNIYASLGDFGKAMDYSMQSLNIAQEQNNGYFLYLSYLNFGNLYSLIGDHDKSNEYFQKLPDLIKKLGLGNDQLSTLYNGLGENFRLTQKYSEALDYYKKALSITTIALNKLLFKGNMADVYIHLDSLQLAFDNAYQALPIAKELGATDLESWIYGILSRAHFKENRADSALYYAEKGYGLAVKTRYMEDLRENAKALSEAFLLNNDYKNAYTYRNLYISYRDSMQSDEIRNRSTLLEHNFEIQLKEDEIALLNEQRKLQQNFLISALIVLGLILITAFLLIRNIRQKQKANRLLQKQKLEIDEKARQLAIQKDSLEKSYNNVELLGEIGRQITASLSVDKIIGTVYNNVNGLMDASIFGIGIYHDETKTLDFPSTYENGEALPPYTNSIQDPNRLAALCFNSGNEIIINDLNEEYGKYLQKMPTASEGKVPVSLIYIPLKVKGKMFGVVTVQSFKQNTFTDYHLYMLRTIALYSAIALDNAESFYKLNTTINTLQETQKQLVQSEKMASLGELTAGIAHEIQNPLNFVNNFSEVSNELIEEIEEERAKSPESRDETLVSEILGDIKQNLIKIKHHGKRADSIVKGMLQHSRTSSGEAILTDINTLADEFLRLSYHGLRAKDKTFNADFKMDFDPDLPKIHVVPQDMGRVFLNIINNAFYAVDKKSKSGIPDYKPAVVVQTKKLDKVVEITISDNGSGIPTDIKDKIFQPFFTTKPTGQGTGLGLSLSYDIVKAHGGEIIVESKVGEDQSEEQGGTSFIITLPLA